MGKARLLLWLAVPLACTAAVYYPITRGYFFADDFLVLYQMINVDLAEYLLTPHGGHIFLARNAWFWACFQAFGTDPQGYFWLVLLTHLLNVTLLFVVVTRFTNSALLACFVATLWGTSPMHEETLGWCSVYGQVFATTMMLLILFGVARLRAENRPPTRGILALWYGLALIGCTSFGVGIGVAMVMPVALALLLPKSVGRACWRLPLLSLLLVVPVFYAGVYWLYGALSGNPPLAGGTLEFYFLHWRAVFPMLMHLFITGVTEISLGFLREPGWSTRPVSLLIFWLWTFGAVRLLHGGARNERERLLAFLLLALGCYGVIALGRGSFFESAVPFGAGVRAGAASPRYHYAAFVPLTLLLCTILQQVRPSGRKAAVVAVSAWLVLAVAAWFMTPMRIDHHDASRNETTGVLATIRASVGGAREGTDVRLPNPRFEAVGPLVPKTMFPGWAAVFTIFFPDNTVDGRRIYFLEPKAGVVKAAKRGKRIRNVLLPVRARHRNQATKPRVNWFERKLDSINRR